jgi:hypothetical protein
MRKARSCGDEDGYGDGVGDPFTACKIAKMVAVICFARILMLRDADMPYTEVGWNNGFSIVWLM